MKISPTIVSKKEPTTIKGDIDAEKFSVKASSALVSVAICYFCKRAITFISTKEPHFFSSS